MCTLDILCLLINYYLYIRRNVFLFHCACPLVIYFIFIYSTYIRISENSRLTCAIEPLCPLQKVKWTDYFDKCVLVLQVPYSTFLLGSFRPHVIYYFHLIPSFFIFIFFCTTITHLFYYVFDNTLYFITFFIQKYWKCPIFQSVDFFICSCLLTVYIICSPLLNNTERILFVQNNAV